MLVGKQSVNLTYLFGFIALFNTTNVASLKTLSSLVGELTSLPHAFESSKSSILDIDLQPKSKYEKCKIKCADTTSIPNKSIFSFSKTQDKRKTINIMELDS